MDYENLIKQDRYSKSLIDYLNHVEKTMNTGDHVTRVNKTRVNNIIVVNIGNSYDLSNRPYLIDLEDYSDWKRTCDRLIKINKIRERM